MLLQDSSHAALAPRRSRERGRIAGEFLSAIQTDVLIGLYVSKRGSGEPERRRIDGSESLHHLS
jgi:hypothetical protein